MTMIGRRATAHLLSGHPRYQSFAAAPAGALPDAGILPDNGSSRGVLLRLDHHERVCAGMSVRSVSIHSSRFSAARRSASDTNCSSCWCAADFNR
jgi:hypothetical protein